MNMTFSDKLAAAIHEKNMSIRELSEKTGIPKSAIQRYTSGDTEKIPIDRMKLMAEALSIDPAFIMGWDTDTAQSIPNDEYTPQTPEARIVSGGMDKLPEAQRQQILGVVRAMFANNPDLFKEGE